MITLNLLDEKRKKGYLIRRVILTIQKAVEVFFFFILVIGIVFSVAQYCLEKNFQTVAEQSAFINQSVGAFNQEIGQINYQLKTIDEIKTEYLTWSPLLVELTYALPNNVKISLLSIDKQGATIKIEGQAKTRDDFLLLKQNLENIYFITKVESPLANLLKKEDVEFECLATIDLSQVP